MVKLLKHGNTVNAVFSNGDQYQLNNVTNEQFINMCKQRNNEDVMYNIFNPHIKEIRKEVEAKQMLLNRIKNSQYLQLRGQAIICPQISEVSMPEDLAESILNCEDRLQNNINDTEANTLFEAYTNFWTLVCLNPDSRIRTNLFWFLHRNGMVISKSGLFVAYRNVDVKTVRGQSYDLFKIVGEAYQQILGKLHDDPNNYVIVTLENDVYDRTNTQYDWACLNDLELDDDETIVDTIKNLYDSFTSETTDYVFTDHHSHTFNIRLGHPVSMPREDVNCDSNVTCSCGLHVASRDWLTQNYFGDLGMCVLVNPADVCALPMQDDYGKMRVCEYYPWSIIRFDKEGRVIDPGITDGFEDDHSNEYIQQIMEKYNINNNDPNQFIINIPNMPEINKDMMTQRLLELAVDCKKFQQYVHRESEGTEC